MNEMLCTYDWVTQPWYVEQFGGHEVKELERHKEYFERAVARTDCWEKSGEVFLSVFLDGVHVGNAGIKNMNRGGGELWYYIGSSQLRGQGVGSELVKKLVEYGKKSCLLTWFYARVANSNIASQKVLEKCEFTCVSEKFDPDFQTYMLRYEYGSRCVEL